MNASRLLVAAAASIFCAASATAAPTYGIVDLGRPGANRVGHADAISTSGNYVVGRGVVGSNNAFAWDQSTGANTILTPLAGNANSWAVGVNDSGTTIGMVSASAALTDEGTAYNSAVPVVWKNGTPTALAASGRVFGINNAGLAVGSSGTIGAVNQRAVIYDTNTLGTSFITATTAAGASMKSATAISNNGLVVGTGIRATADGSLAVGLAYNPATGTMTEFANAGGVSGVTNGALSAYGISVSDVNSNGLVVGTTTYTNTGVDETTPFAWSAAGGMTAVPLPAGMVGGYATGVNDSGWIVGYAHGDTDSNQYAFLDIAGSSYLLSKLVSDATGWNLAASANLTITGIGNDGTISGYTYLTEASGSDFIHAFALQMTSAVPEPGSPVLMFAGLLAVGAIARRRKS